MRGYQHEILMICQIDDSTKKNFVDNLYKHKKNQILYFKVI
jgi:hypothetical protein